ncbi:hypothetical protein [Actinoplanes sp. L3-i22]|uniref:hypothetical protein n=1 Tax=Actinoplanes sp. L3-i22 TaxID=2836373 RepID=UPI001C76A769|nr:hypothetical protein [Actinoplanes sp. L3-i22]BCY13843.1 hypothetical protein L3i22_089310 [Actinoplanes sp. L3-i22]
MGYEWLAVALQALRGISPAEVNQVLGARRRRPVPAEAAGLPVITVWGRTVIGRPLIVVVRQVGDFDYMIIGAREMDEKQLGQFEQWEGGQS